MTFDPRLDGYISMRSALNAEQLFTSLQAPREEYRKIPLELLESLLNTKGLMRAITALIADTTAPQELRDGLSDFVLVLKSTRLQNLGTDVTEIRTRFLQVCGALKQVFAADPDKTAALDTIIGLAVIPYTDAARLIPERPITQEEVTEAKARYDLRKAMNQVAESVFNTIATADVPPATLSEIVSPLLAGK